MLNEEDVRFGLWKRRTITPDTRAGLSLLQHGLWQRAQDVFYNAMNRATQVYPCVPHSVSCVRIFCNFQKYNYPGL